MNKNFRSSEAKVAEAIIDEEITALKERLRYLTMRPVMVQLHEKMNFLRQKVLKRAFAKLPNLTDKERRIIDIMTQRLEHKFLREPMTAMNSAAGTADEERYRDMICELFLLNDSGEDYIGDENKFDYWD
jgi:glutamyl-tRNA reductase